MGTDDSELVNSQFSQRVDGIRAFDVRLGDDFKLGFQVGRSNTKLQVIRLMDIGSE